MAIKYTSPYGVSSFKNFNKLNRAFVDKTEFINVIDKLDTPYPVLLRPRRFGKTTFVQMLDYFYDISKKDQYDEVFRGTKIIEKNLPSHNTYHVLNLEFSEIYGNTSAQLVEGFTSNIIDSITDFIDRYPEVNFEVDEYKNKTPSALINAFFTRCKIAFKGKQDLYVIIDEYDNFANVIFSKDRKLFNEITSANGFFKAFYNAIKKHTTKVIAKTFITGVSSVSLDSLTSGFNIAKNVTCDPRLNEFAGFTKDELIGLIEKLVDTKALNTTAEVLAENMRKAYNGYAFNRKAKNTLFNSSMCLNYLDAIETEGELLNPEDIVDTACGYDTSKIADIFKYSQEYILNEIIDDYYTKNEFVIGKLAESINLNLIENYDKDTVLSLMYYLGYLTIKPCNILNEVHLVCPNRIMKNVFRKCFTQALVNETTDEKALKFDVKNMKLGLADVQDFMGSVQQYFLLRTTHQHLLHMSEAYLVGVIKAKLESEPTLASFEEQAIHVPNHGEKFVDLLIDNKKGTCYLFEFKFYSKNNALKHPNILQEKIAEATAQINSYKTAVEFKGKIVYSYIVIFEAANLVHFEQC